LAAKIGASVTVFEVVVGPDHRVREAICGDRELDRHERPLLPAEELQRHARVAGRIGPEDLVDHVGACDAAQKVVHDHPLVVPGNQAPGLLEQCRAGEAQL